MLVVVGLLGNELGQPVVVAAGDVDIATGVVAACHSARCSVLVFAAAADLGVCQNAAEKCWVGHGAAGQFGATPAAAGFEEKAEFVQQAEKQMDAGHSDAPGNGPALVVALEHPEADKAWELSGGTALVGLVGLVDLSQSGLQLVWAVGFESPYWHLDAPGVPLGEPGLALHSFGQQVPDLVVAHHSPACFQVP